MSDNGFRIIGLNALGMLLVGMFLGGMPLVWVVAQSVYHQAAPIQTGGDYRGWMMAHLEGLLNGLMVVAVAVAVRVRPMTAGREGLFVPALLVGGWGNTIASILAPVLGVRGMVFDASAPNNLITGLFTLALVGGVTALIVAIRHLWGR